MVTAKVTAVDTKNRKLSFELADGKTKKVKVGSQVDMNAIRAGENLTVQLSEGLAIAVVKP
jgi:hypothetical protein